MGGFALILGVVGVGNCVGLEGVAKLATRVKAALRALDLERLAEF